MSKSPSQTEIEFWAEVERIIGEMELGLIDATDHDCNPPFGQSFCEFCAAHEIRHA
jgi:hypothetical protein